MEDAQEYLAIKRKNYKVRIKPNGVQVWYSWNIYKDATSVESGNLSDLTKGDEPIIFLSCPIEMVIK